MLANENPVKPSPELRDLLTTVAFLIGLRTALILRGLSSCSLCVFQFLSANSVHVMYRLQHPRPSFLSYSRQSVRAPFALMCDGDRKCVGPGVRCSCISESVYAIERVACSIDRQRLDVEGLAIRRNSGMQGVMCRRTSSSVMDDR